MAFLVKIVRGSVKPCLSRFPILSMTSQSFVEISSLKLQAVTEIDT